jgi:predicted ATPase
VRALALIPHLADDQRPPAELDLQMALGSVYRALRGSGSTETERTYARASVLCRQLGDDDRLLEVVYGQFISDFNRPELHRAHRFATEFMAIAEAGHNASARTVANLLIGATAFLLGDLLLSRRHLADCLRLDGADGMLVAQYSHGQHPAFPLMYLAWTLFAQGYPEQAHARARDAIAASEGRSAFFFAMALGNGCYLHQLSGNCAAVEANLSVLLDLAEEKGIVAYHANARLFQGWTRACAGAVDEGIALMRDALERIAATEQLAEHPYMLSILAETLLRAGRLAEAQEQLDAALALVQATDERWYEAELFRLAGGVELARGDTGTAELQLDRALAVARAQGARLWELRAAADLARLWAERGERRRALELLAPIYGWFTEGLDTRDLRNARELLDELR